MPMANKTRTTLLLVAVGLAAALAGFGVARWLQTASVETPAAATDFALRDLAGKTHGLADWRGKLVLLNFWASWCPPCLKEIPVFVELQRRYAGRGLQIVGIGVDNPEAVARTWQELHINYPLLLADESSFALMAAYGNTHGSLPYSAVIRPDGQVAAVKLGAYGHDELEKLLLPLLPAQKPASN